MSVAAPGTRHWFRVEACNSSGRASSGWQLALTPTASMATAAGMNANPVPLNGFSIDASPTMFHPTTNVFAGRVQTVGLGQLDQHIPVNAVAPQSWQPGGEASAVTLTTPGSAADKLDSHLEAFGGWQGEDSQIDWRGDVAGAPLLDVLADSVLAAKRGEPDNASIAEWWERL
jgi:hypothetical protein